MCRQLSLFRFLCPTFFSAGGISHSSLHQTITPPPLPPRPISRGSTSQENVKRKSLSSPNRGRTDSTSAYPSPPETSRDSNDNNGAPPSFSRGEKQKKEGGRERGVSLSSSRVGVGVGDGCVGGFGGNSATREGTVGSFDRALFGKMIGSVTSSNNVPLLGGEIAGETGKRAGGEGGDVQPRLVSSGKGALGRAAAAVFAGAGFPTGVRDSGKGFSWAMKEAGASIGRRGTANILQRRGSWQREREEGGGEYQEEEGGEGEEGEAEGEKVDGEKPTLLAVTVGEVYGELSDVQWSVQMQNKRFLRMEDSGSVK